MPNFLGRFWSWGVCVWSRCIFVTYFVQIYSSIVEISAFYEIQYGSRTPSFICPGTSWDQRRRPIHGGYPCKSFVMIRLVHKLLFFFFIFVIYYLPFLWWIKIIISIRIFCHSRLKVLFSIHGPKISVFEVWLPKFSKKSFERYGARCVSALMGVVTLTFDLLTSKLVCASKVGNLRSEFWNARPLGSRVICYVRNGRADGQKKTTFTATFLRAGA